MRFRTLWLSFGAVVILSFAVLGWIGVRIYQEVPPMPERVVTTDGTGHHRRRRDRAGQNVWQSMGGMEVGSVWGHGSYVAPDWTADWLHREAIVHPRRVERGRQTDFAELPPERQAELQSRLERLMRTNTYDPNRRRVTIDPVRAEAFEANAAHYADVFANGRDEYAIPAGAVTDPTTLRQTGGLLLLDLVGGARRTGRATTSPTPATGRTSRWSATGRPAKPSSGPA